MNKMIVYYETFDDKLLPESIWYLDSTGTSL